jgi:DNA-binding PadR family transcriptional regulator
MIKRGKKNRPVFIWIYSNRLRKAITSVFDKPLTISEIIRLTTKIFDLNKRPKISNYVKELENENIIKCLTPALKPGKPGRVYGLTEKGLKLRKKICKKDNLPFHYKNDDTNWENYGWCLSGTQKKAVLISLTTQPQRQRDLKEKIREFYKNRNRNTGITTQNLNDLLQLMAKKKIVKREDVFLKKRKKPIRKYQLSPKGVKIKNMVTFTHPD